jgi:RNA polymerase sigma-70 factor, ECF subfamily
MMTTQNNLSELSDADVVVLAQGGDREAFSQLMARHYRTSVNLAASILRDRTEAEDQAQNAWTKALEHLDQFQGDAKFSTWLTRIVVNQCLMRLRQQRRARFISMDEQAQDSQRGPFELADDRAVTDQDLGKRQVATVVLDEVRRIPPLLRNVVVLRDIQQLSMAEVAGRLGISVPAAKSRLLRARTELRTRLQRHCGRMGAATLMA